MYKLFFILPILLIAGCNSHSSLKNRKEIKRKKAIASFARCFAGIDTTKTGQCISCGAGTYKMINDKYVIWIRHEFVYRLDSCYNITIDSLNTKVVAELRVYDNHNATLENICTDVINVNLHEPTRKLIAKKGQLIIGLSESANLNGDQARYTTILIKKLTFEDTKSGEIITFENELLWKVHDEGTPG